MTPTLYGMLTAPLPLQKTCHYILYLATNLVAMATKPWLFLLGDGWDGHGVSREKCHIVTHYNNFVDQHLVTVLLGSPGGKLTIF